MSTPFFINLLVIIQIVTAAFCILIAINLYNRIEISSARRLAYVMVALGIWTFASGMETAVLTRDAKIGFSKVMYLGLQSVPPLMLIFSIEYSGRKSWLTKRNQALLWAIPVITLLLVATNEYHALIWKSIEPNPNGNNAYLVYSHGVWFWISSLYLYCLTFASSILLVLGAKEKKHKSQFWQVSVVLVGLAIAWGANIAYILKISPIPGLDFTPISFAITIALISLVIYPLHFLDISPVARSKLVDTMSDAFFVLDQSNRLIDTNPTGLRLLGKKREDWIGAAIQEFFAPWPELIQRLNNPEKLTSMAFVIQDSAETWYDVRITSLSKEKITYPGWLVILHDISHSKITEKALAHQATGLRIVSEISLTIAASDQPESLLQNIVDLTSERFGFDYVQIFLLDEHAPVLRMAAGSGEVGKTLFTSNFTIPLAHEKSIIAWTANHRRARIVNDVQNSEIFLPNPNLPQTQSEMAVPILFRDKLLGILDIQSNKRQQFHEIDQHIKTTLAAQISISMMNARLINDLHTRATEAETLRQAISAVTSTLNQDEAIDRILEQLRSVIPYDSSSVQLLKGETLEIVGGLGFTDIQRIMGLRFPVHSDSPSTTVVKTKSPLILEDAQESYCEFRHPPHNHIHGWMGVPLIVQQKVIGIITLDSTQPGAFSSSQSRLAQAFADHVAAALENIRLFEDTRRLAIMDPLTNVFNRRHFYELAKVEYERSCRYHRPISAIMIDLDHFKRVNDTYGHSTGDLVLQAIAETCQRKLRKSDIFGRYGGEEFVIIMPETDEQRAWNVAERLRRSIVHISIPINDGAIAITISLGVATLSPEDLCSDNSGDLLEKLIDKADQALYQAKQAGRNRVIVHQENVPI